VFGLPRRRTGLDHRIMLRTDRPDFVYAIGDIHGCYEELKSLEAQIADDIVSHGLQSIVVYLGDMIDRGPASDAVIDHLLSRRPPFPRLLVGGNHEELFLDFLAAPSPRHSWLHLGGTATLQSYGLDPTAIFNSGRNGAAMRLASHIPEEHLSLLRDLPLCISFPGLVLVHAGLEEGVPLEGQRVEKMRWIRLPIPAYTRPQPFGLLVHGHTPANLPVVEEYRVCVDTGAYATGRLTAVRVDRQNSLRFFTTRMASNRNDNS
jgi:serine/threonine protein phosphatase 1